MEHLTRYDGFGEISTSKCLFRPANIERAPENKALVVETERRRAGNTGIFTIKASFVEVRELITGPRI